jgi:uncharacterized membrane protein
VTTRGTRAMGGTRTIAIGATLFGVGVSGFVDGIVFHQVLQWHHVVSHTDGSPMDTLSGLRSNTRADGLFHVAALLATVLGVVAVLAGVRASGAALDRGRLMGRALVGFGVFNLAEGIIDHHVLELHHVRQTVPESQWLAYDLGFLALLGLLPTAAGLVVLRRRTGDGPA